MWRFCETPRCLWEFTKVLHEGGFTKLTWRFHEVPKAFMRASQSPEYLQQGFMKPTGALVGPLEAPKGFKNMSSTL